LANYAALSNRIVLNVGGQRFETSKSNLLRFPNSYFTGLLSETAKWKPDNDGSYFIDRSPEGFPAVLEYLRGNDDFLEAVSKKVKPLVLSHLDYFALPIRMSSPQRMSGIQIWFFWRR
jgi:hypothetical protein